MIGLGTCADLEGGQGNTLENHTFYRFPKKFAILEPLKIIVSLEINCLTHYLLVSSADILCKQFDARNIRKLQELKEAL